METLLRKKEKWVKKNGAEGHVGSKQLVLLMPEIFNHVFKTVWCKMAGLASHLASPPNLRNRFYISEKELVTLDLGEISPDTLVM